MADTKYCYPDSDVLINKLDIHDMDKQNLRRLVPSFFILPI